MAILTVPKANLKAGEKVPEGWHKATVTKIVRALNKKQNGMNIVATFSIPDEEGDTKEKNAWYAEKYLGKEFIYFYGAVTGEDITPYINKEKELEFDPDTLAEYCPVEVWVKIKHGVYNGAISDSVDSVMSASEEPPFGQ